MDIKIIPNEIWIKILSHVNNTDLKAVRLAGNAELGSLASSTLFTTAFIAARKGVLDTFVELTTHPEFRKYVTKIVYDSSFLDPQIVEEQPARKCGTQMTAMFQSTALDSDDTHARRQSGGLITLLECLSKHVTSTLHDISLGDNLYAAAYGVVPIGIFTTIIPKNPSQNLEIVFGQLRRVYLRIFFSVVNEKQQSVHASGEDLGLAGDALLRILTSARDLEELKLISEYKSYPLRLKDTLSTYKWEKLRLLHITNFKGAIPDLSDLIRRHAESLRHMTLGQFYLSSGKWSDLEKEFPNIAPNFELLFDLGKGANTVKKLYIPENVTFDESGLQLMRLEIYEDPPDGGEDEEEEGENRQVEEDEDEDATDEESSIDLSYYSDDSSSSTASNPRRKSASSFLSSLAPELRAKVERLQQDLEGCSVDQCHNALIINGGDHDSARSALLSTYGVECYSVEIQTAAEILEETMPFDVDEEECIEALLDNNGSLRLAKRELKSMYGYRQKIWMGLRS